MARVEKVVPGCIGSSIGLQVGDYIETIGGQKMRASPESVQFTIVREEGEDAIREGIVSAFPRPEEMLEKTDALVDIGFRRGGQTFERSLGPGEGALPEVRVHDPVTDQTIADKKIVSAASDERYASDEMLSASCSLAQSSQEIIDGVKEDTGANDLQAWGALYEMGFYSLESIQYIRNAAAYCNTVRGTSFYVPDTEDIN